MAWDELSDKGMGGSESPVMGSGLTRATGQQWPEGLVPKVRYYMGSMGSGGDVILLEQILTRSLLNQGDLEKPGDIIVLREDHNFTKDGDYQIAIKYIELVKKEVERPEDARTLDEVV